MLVWQITFVHRSTSFIYFLFNGAWVFYTRSFLLLLLFLTSKPLPTFVIYHPIHNNIIYIWNLWLLLHPVNTDFMQNCEYRGKAKILFFWRWKYNSIVNNSKIFNVFQWSFNISLQYFSAKFIINWWFECMSCANSICRSVCILMRNLCIYLFLLSNFTWWDNIFCVFYGACTHLFYLFLSTYYYK